MPIKSFMRTDGRMKILGDEKACHKKSLSRTKMDKRVAIMRQGDNTRGHPGREDDCIWNARLFIFLVTFELCRFSSFYWTLRKLLTSLSLFLARFCAVFPGPPDPWLLRRLWLRERLVRVHFPGPHSAGGCEGEWVEGTRICELFNSCVPDDKLLQLLTPPQLPWVIGCVVPELTIEVSW